MLLPGVTIVGRQTPTPVGYPDLLGIDGDDRLVVFELKRGTLTREAVAQLLDYGSFLESLNDEDLAELITRESGNHGVKKIDNFEEWYQERTDKPLEHLRPSRMVLVGLGADDRARRIVEFLQGTLEISIVTLHGFRHEGATLLATHTGVTETRPAPPLPRPSREERIASLAARAADLGISDVWDDATRILNPFERQPDPTKSGFTFYAPRPLVMPELPHAKAAHTTHSLTLDSTGKLRITFFPVSVELCFDRFEQKARALHFQREPPPNAPVTERVKEQSYVLLNQQEWEEHKDSLVELTRAIATAWSNRLRDAAMD